MVEGCSAGHGRLTRIIGAWHDGDRAWLNMLGGNALGTGRIVALAPLEGPVLAAWREPQIILDDGRNCLVTALAVGGGRAAVVAHFSDWVDMSRSRAWLYVATPETIGATTEPMHIFPSGFVQRGRSIHDLWISDQLLALQPSPDGSLYTYREGEWATLTGRGTVPGLPRNVALVGDHLLWEAWSGLYDVRLVHARWGEAASVWRDISPGDTLASGTDGADVAWTECHESGADGSCGRLELWTAQYQRNIESTVARELGPITAIGDAAVGGGWYAIRRISDGPQRVEVYSLRDGSRRTFVAPEGFVTADPYYATEREIVFRGVGTWAYRFDPTLLSVDP